MRARSRKAERIMKKLFKIVVVLVLLLVVVGVAGLLFIDQAAAAAIERGGTYALGVETELGSADVELFEGRFGLESLTIDNPQGFQKSSFLSLAKGEMELELNSLTKETLVVPRLELQGIELDLERAGTSTNFGAILANLERFESGKQPGAPPAEGGRKVLIKEIAIRDIAVSVDIGQSVAGFQNTSFPVPDIVLQELGTGGEGKPISEHFSTILRALIDKALEAGKGKIPTELLTELEGQLSELGLPEGVETQVESAIEGAKEMVGEEAKKIGDDAAKKLQELGDSYLKKKQPSEKPDGGSL